MPEVRCLPVCDKATVSSGYSRSRVATCTPRRMLALVRSQPETPASRRHQRGGPRP
ncbi:hypothetical protein FMEAI12_7220002 [Parafrankia sp. Ea1.12]|nr:hypothetical protein FMEAI12_7220002 [Parafrankia sp. Ea1.12]